MEKIMEPFDEIKFSALSKSKYINPFIKNVTIGPNRTIVEEGETEVDNSINISITAKQTKPAKVMCHPPKCSSTNLIINQFVSELEKQRHEKVKEAVNKRIDYIKQFSEKQKIETKQRILIQHQLVVDRHHQEELQIVNAIEQHERDASKQHQQQIQYYKELAEKKKKADLELQEKEKRKQQIHALLDRITVDQLEFRNVYQDISTTLKSCKYLSQLKVALGDSIKHFKDMPERMDEIVTQCRNGIVSDSDAIKTGTLVLEIKELLEVVKQKVLEVNEAAETPAQISVSMSSITTHSSDTTITTPTQSSSIQSIEIEKFVSKLSLKIYAALQSYIQAFESSLIDFTKNDSLKQFRFDCKKAVNIPVNAISATSSEHLKDKYDRLSNLLNGSTVEVGGTRVCAANHPQGVAYCKNALADIFVLQGDLMISGKPEAAFPYSAIIIALWNEHSDFGKLLLAHFHLLCPYTVPIYPPRSIGQTDEEFYRSQGYRYSEGVVEKQDKFLKRMAGTLRLYAAIIITQPKRGQAKNPLGLNEGWRWLAAFVNLEPKPDITATMLHVFLETAGSALEAAYRISFMKLMMYICKVYLPIIQEIDSGGPVTRLEVLLQNYIKKGHFEPPSGMLANNFW